jgi:formate dehydrogenase assembly factor FdhD
VLKVAAPTSWCSLALALQGLCGEAVADTLTPERLLQITVNGQSYSVTMQTPRCPKISG